MIAERLNPSRIRPAEGGWTISLGNYWNRLTIAPILFVAALLNFWGLSQEGYGNTYYAAAVRSMTQNWHAFFFNSLDSAGFVTIDKPPLGFWLQVASAKVFGYSGLALMLPQALAGVLSVGLLYYLVSRFFGKPAGVLAALALAITPISVVANRNNIVDSTLVFVVLLGACAVTRAIETGKLRWLLLCALFVGLGFNVKMLEAFLVLPAFGLMYLVGARIGWRRRIFHLLAAGVALLAISLSWVTVVDLTPASQRPYVGSTTDNSALSLAIGYNGLQRLTGRTSAQPGGGGGGGNGGPGGVGENGNVGPLRLLNTQLGGQISWLLPLAVLGFFTAAWQTRRRLWPLNEKQSAVLMWGVWLATMAVFFSIAGFYHTYYLVMIAPAIAALAGIGMAALWQAYRQPNSKIWWLLPASFLLVAGVQVHLLADYPAWSTWLTPLILGVSILAALAMAMLHFRPRIGLRFMVGAVVLGVAALLAAPATWSVTSVSAANSALLPRAGPSTSAGNQGPGGFGGGPSGNFRPPNGFTPPNGGSRAAGGPPPGVTRGSGPRNGGGPGGNNTVNTALVKYLKLHQGTATYLFATTSAGTAESYIIATGKAVMATGGFTGSDPILTPAKLATLVKQGVVHYFLLSGGGFGGPGGGNSDLTSWVQANCTVVPASKYSASTTASTGSDQLYACGVTR